MWKSKLDQPTPKEMFFFNVYYYSRYLTTLTCGSKEWPPKSELQRRRKLYVQARKIKWKWNLKLLPERNLPSPKSEQIQCRRTCSGPPRSINSTCGILPTLLNPIFYECVISAIFVNFLTSSRMFENYFFLLDYVKMTRTISTASDSIWYSIHLIKRPFLICRVCMWFFFTIDLHDVTKKSLTMHGGINEYDNKSN